MNDHNHLVTGYIKTSNIIHLRKYTALYNMLCLVLTRERYTPGHATHHAKWYA